MIWVLPFVVRPTASNLLLMQNQASDPGPEGLLDLLEHLVDQEPTVPGELIQYLLRSVGADA
jgi:hypothetical protein